MVGSIERLRRQLQACSFAPMMLLVIGVPGTGTTDPIAKRVGGTAGVIAIPATAAAPATGIHSDAAPDSRRDTRAERGRVLYAPGHAPRDTVASAARPTRKQVCVDQQAIRGRAGHNSAPTF